jgi:hypothetical protein
MTTAGASWSKNKDERFEKSISFVCPARVFRTPGRSVDAGNKK